jgi:NAD-dependent DNA ligase
MLDAKKLMRAHQYLYYVKNLPVITDREFDRFCSQHGLEGIAGSDRESDYTEEERALAQALQEGNAKPLI